MRRSLGQQKVIQASIVAFAIVVYLALAFGSALTKSPEIDEGFFANPAFNLATRGFLGTTVLETTGSALKGINDHTYWVPPLHLILQAGWYKLFGFSLGSMRSISIAWGLVALVAWFLIMRQLSQEYAVALLTAGLLALDYTFIVVSSLGRMDMMCAALGYAGFATYLTLRQRSLKAAILASNGLIVLSGLTHPNGVLYLAGLILITLYFDRRSLSAEHVAIAIVPYLLGAVGWGLYILQDPSAFSAQFASNARDGGRLVAMSKPWIGFINEFTVRYPHAFGLTIHSAGHSGPIYLKALLLIPYVVALIWGFASRRVRNHTGYRCLLMLVLLNFVLLALIDGQKETIYLIHLVPIYVALFAVFTRRVWEVRIIPRWLVAVSLVGFLALEVSGMVLRIRQRTYQKLYQPAIAFLEERSDGTTQITGSSALGFGLSFPPNLVDDTRLGYASGRRPRFIVISSEYELSYSENLDRQPDLKRYITDLLANTYKLAYQNDGFKIYERR